MKRSNMRLVCLLLVMLLAAAALTGCGQNNSNTTAAPVTTQAPATTQAATQAPATTQAATEAPVSTQAPAESTQAATVETQAGPAMEATEAGQGEKSFYFQVSFADGSTSAYEVHSDADTVGEALQSLELIDGDDSEYGLYVTTVCGQTLNWDADHMYWAFYENGEYANAGVDTTNITEGNVYSFVATAG